MFPIPTLLPLLTKLNGKKCSSTGYLARCRCRKDNFQFPKRLKKYDNKMFNRRPLVVIHSIISISALIKNERRQPDILLLLLLTIFS
jgi:hypothetical protein